MDIVLKSRVMSALIARKSLLRWWQPRSFFLQDPQWRRAQYMMKSWNVVLRVLVFIFAVRCGLRCIGLMANAAATRLFAWFGRDMFVLQVSLAFIVLGIVAERKQ